jgi:DNA-binding NtrC family response regulator
MNTLLIIDDEVGIQRTISTVLTSDTLRVITASNENQAIQALKTERPSVVLLDLRLGKESGWDVFNKLKAVDPKILIIFITGHGNSDTAIESMKLGAFDYLVKPLDIDQLCQVVSQAFKIAKMMRAPAEMGSQDIDDSGSDRLIGNGAAMQSICKQIGRIAPQDINVLVLGESGTGKELIARAIYQHSRRSNQPYLAINCAAIPEPLLESELFGHEKGAFTGADKQRIGKFEQCHGGTIFLDEIGDMPIATQAKILRLLQDGQFQRVGVQPDHSSRRPSYCSNTSESRPND